MSVDCSHATTGPSVRVELPRTAFHPDERVFLDAAGIAVTTFRFSSGVEAVRVRTRRMELVVLPFLGQQVWSAAFDGHDVGMRSMVRTPRKGVPLLENLGGFLFHCGLTAIGSPSEGDDHPLHGELPSAEFDRAWIEVRMEDGKTEMSICGSFEYARAFAAHYVFRPAIVLDPMEAAFDVRVEVENLKSTPMDLCYLCHVNFRPMDGSRLVYSAPYGADAVTVRNSIPDHLPVAKGYRSLLTSLEHDPSRHHAISDTRNYEPEVVFEIEYRADSEGWAHALQRHSEGSADWIAHRPQELPRAFRWLSRSKDQDCLAITEPATCGIAGRSHESRIGAIPKIEAATTWNASIRVGRLAAPEAEEMSRRIDRLCGRA